MRGPCHLARIELASDRPGKLAQFYESVFGFEKLGAQPHEPLLVLEPDSCQLGIVATGPRAASPAAAVPGNSTRFQHFAIDVSDMPSACDRLAMHSDWSAISIGGPQRLPSASGGVTAFKFRDPDGHPLELLWRPRETRRHVSAHGVRGLFLGIDHSAISVADSNRSIDFYAQLGLMRTGGSVNVGVEQDRLDGMPGVRVEVTALSVPGTSGTHVELLCYGQPAERVDPPHAAEDLHSTRLVFTINSERTFEEICRRHAPLLPVQASSQQHETRYALIRDPDGHLLRLELPVAP